MVAVYLVFQIPGSPSRLMESTWVAQDNAFASLLNDILKAYLEMLHILAFFLGRYFNKLVCIRNIPESLNYTMTCLLGIPQIYIKEKTHLIADTALHMSRYG